MPKTLQETTATLTVARDHLWQATKKIYEKTIKSAARGPSPSRRTTSFDATDFRAGRGGGRKARDCHDDNNNIIIVLRNPFFVGMA